MYTLLKHKVLKLSRRVRTVDLRSPQKKFRDSFIAGERIDEISSDSREAYIEYLESIIKDSGLFDKSYYLHKYKDVGRSGINPLRHFLLYGGTEGRNPSEQFNTGYYLFKHPEAKTAHINPLVDHLRHSFKLSKGDRLLAYSESKRKQYVTEFDKRLSITLNNTPNVIVMESMAWEGVLQQRPHHIARLMAEDKIVIIYIDQHMVTPPVEVAKNLFLVPDQTYYRKVAKSKAPHKYLWLFSTQNYKHAFVKNIKEKGFEIIYDYIDDIDPTISGEVVNQLENFKKLKSLNPKILIASAKKLQTQLQVKFPDRDILLCQNAVDLSHFDYSNHNPEKPADMLAILQQKKPIVGYYGAIAPWLDYTLINDITQHRKDLNFVFIGVDYNGGLSKLDLRDNVHFLGAKDYRLLSQYSYWFDCAIVPFKTGEIAKSTSPVKLFEYMAMALPTVCTKDLQECYGYDHVLISKNKDEFNVNLDVAIKIKHNKSTTSKLIKQAEANTWQARAKSVAERINELSKKGVN